MLYIPSSQELVFNGGRNEFPYPIQSTSKKQKIKNQYSLFHILLFLLPQLASRVIFILKYYPNKWMEIKREETPMRFLETEYGENPSRNSSSL